MALLNISRESYHADDVGCDTPTLSASIASILLRDSPKHAWCAHPKLGGAIREETETFDLGTAAHAYILEGREDRYAIVEADDWRTKAAREARIAAREQGRIPLLARQIENVRQMAHAVRAQLAEFQDEPAPLADGQPEQTLVWQEGDIWCKARLDWLHDDWMTIDDLKTGAVSAKPDAWTRTMYGAGKDLQAAFYLRGLISLGQDTFGPGCSPTFRFIVAENRYPYATSVIALSPEGLAHANQKVEEAIRLWSVCVGNNNWPGYPLRTCYIDPPAWALAQYYDEATEEIPL